MWQLRCIATRGQIEFRSISTSVLLRNNLKNVTCFPPLWDNLHQVWTRTDNVSFFDLPV